LLARAPPPPPPPASAANSRLIFNNQLDAAVTAGLVLMVALVLIESIRQWLGVLRGQREIVMRETPFVRTRLAEDRI
jgi:hypothetical protein